MSPIVEIILQLLGGAAGGNIVGGIIKKLSLGPIGNSIIGMLGGFLANWLAARYLGVSLPTSTPAPASVPGGFEDVLSNLLIGAGGGGVLTGVLGAVRSMLGSK